MKRLIKFPLMVSLSLACNSSSNNQVQSNKAVEKAITNQSYDNTESSDVILSYIDHNDFESLGSFLIGKNIDSIFQDKPYIKIIDAFVTNDTYPVTTHGTFEFINSKGHNIKKSILITSNKTETTISITDTN